MNLNQWAIKWGIPFAAIEDLRHEFMTVYDAPPLNPVPGQSEAAVQIRVRLEGAQKGLYLWRNNRGACTDVNGRQIRYGLANDSKKLGDNIKSSDLIGIRPVRIVKEMIGHIFGLFVAREIKEENWRFTGTPEELAQLRFIELVAAAGGDACFANKEGTI